MSHRRPEQLPPGLDGALRNALRLAVESVEPAADGLDRIRARIVSGRRAPWVGWRLVAVTYLDMVWRLLALAVTLIRRAGDAVTARFGREPGRTDLLGWLRPAAAVATFVFVVGSASWAIAVLPSATTSGDQRPYYTQPSGPGGAVSSSSADPGGGSTAYGGATSPGGAVGSPSPSATGSSCPSTTPAPSQSSSSNPAASPSPSPSAPSSSSPVSSSPSASPSSSGSSTSAPTVSPSSAVIPQSPLTSTGPAQTQRAILLRHRQGPGGTAGTRSTVQGSAQSSPAPPTHPAGAPCGG